MKKTWNVMISNIQCPFLKYEGGYCGWYCTQLRKECNREKCPVQVKEIEDEKKAICWDCIHRNDLNYDHIKCYDMRVANTSSKGLYEMEAKNP